MLKFLVFILFLFLENIILPAVIGPSQFLITPVFILGLLVYGPDWKVLPYQVLPLALITEFLTRENLGSLVIPFAIVGVIFITINRFLNLSQSQELSKKGLSDLLIGASMLVIFSYIYSGLFIFFNTAYSLSTAWYEFGIFFKNSLLGLFGWSIVISMLFKYVLKTK